MSARCAALWLLLALPGAAQPHGLALAFLEVRATDSGDWHLALKIPVLGDRQWPLGIDLPQGCETTSAVAPYRLPSGDLADVRVVRCDPAVAGETPVLDVRGLEAGLVDLLVRVEGRRGTDVRVVTSADPTVPLAVEPGSTLWSRFHLGLQHILGGFDHLAFVGGIVLLMGRLRLVLIAVTAFTVAHSLTLALSALNVVTLPGPPVEAVIALSIVYLAREIVARAGTGRSPMSARRAWTVAFGFGLLHGFGFAGALMQTGLPAANLPLTLALFNLGIEAGQLVFVAVLASLLWLAAQPARLYPGRTPQRFALDRGLAYGLGGMACFWTLERLVGMAV